MPTNTHNDQTNIKDSLKRIARTRDPIGELAQIALDEIDRLEHIIETQRIIIESERITKSNE